MIIYWIPSNITISCNEKTYAAARADLLRRVTHIAIPYGDIKKHNNVLLKRK